MAKDTDLSKIKADEYRFLLVAGTFLKRAGSNLRLGKWGIAQGALTGFFNGLWGFVSSSKYLDENQKNLFKKLNEDVFQIRDELVDGVEVGTKKLVDVVESTKAYERLGKVQETFADYLTQWYGPSKA